MNYANSMYLVPWRTRATVIVDTHDFLSLSRHFSRLARALLAEERYEFSSPGSIVAAFLRDTADEVSQEFAALGRSDLTLAISEQEGQIFRDRGGCPVQVLNYCPEELGAPGPPQLSQLGVMPIGTGDNPHNVLGTYCLDRAMRQLRPANVVVAAVGRAAQELRLGSWCHPIGYLADYTNGIRSYSFGVCPAFWGTGAQIKQYEFAELGMPIVAYRWMVDSELWIDGENCLLADDPHEFAERLCSAASCSRLTADLRERATLAKQRMAERQARQQAELDRRLGLRVAAPAV
jgi:hypothetical protein